MTPHHRNPHASRCLVAALSAAFLMCAAVTGGPAAADPAALPTTATEAIARMVDLSRQSEQLNQQSLTAQADLDAKLALQREADDKLAASTAVADAARAEVRRFQPMIDRTAVAAYTGVRTNSMFAVLSSGSPQQLLDKMSTLDVLSQQTADTVRQFKQAADAATAAESVTRAAADAARAATAAADAVRTEVDRKVQDLGVATTQVVEAWGALSARDKSTLAGSPFPPGFDRDSLLAGLVPGSGTSALAAALTRVGDPYVWGATGPDRFDCSGLVQWAFKQVGKNVPRTSSAQAGYGTPVAKDDLQPGDVVLFYSDISHVGIYAGNGMMVHASTFGVPVAVAPINTTPYHSARRY
ncbi:NlpC/P60 family protein [Nocardia mangyaensis]|uniref:NlpC/P60 family protein n=1 Tax=Nocardia mangyaensis TaxID=2213200 RepID=UPI002676E84F|nr:NlpC/P60 family protein [Nocardia mangyaensis]MDO3649952.1 NlpC/P60 family protein [Nocardia mangyaensis]